MTNQQFFALKNLQAPSDGKTHAIKWVTSVSATSVPSEFDFSNIGQNFESGFTPQAVYIDATQATGQVTLYETRTGFKIQVPVGDVGIFFALAVDYPVYQLLGNAGDVVTVIFLDFPAFPQGAAQQNLETVPGSVTVSNTPLPVSVPNPLPIQDNTLAPTITSGSPAASGVSTVSTLWTSGAAVAPANPLPVADTTLAGLVSSLAPAASGLTIIARPAPATLVSGSATASGSTAIGTPPANSNLRKLLLSVTENATQATAGEDVLTIALNGVTVFEEPVYIPATALSSNGQLYQRDIDFSNLAFNAGAAGTLTATLGTALTAGSVNINAYFD